MKQYIGLDVSQKETLACMLNERRLVVHERKAKSEPSALTALHSKPTTFAARGLCLSALSRARKREREDQGCLYRALRRTQGMLRADCPDWQPWLAYFLGSLRF